MPGPVLPQLNGDDYLRWEARQPAKFELHEGFVMAFAGGTIDHGRIALNLQVAFDRLFPAPCQAFGSDVKIRVSASTFYYADAGTICVDVDPHATVIEAPRVVGEVLSPSTRAYDFVEKRAAYRSLPSLEFYVVVPTSLRRIEVDARGADRAWSTAVADHGEAYLGGRALSLDEIYARSSLSTEVL
jgi:Uma2 family endonuclease